MEYYKIYANIIRVLLKQEALVIFFRFEYGVVRKYVRAEKIIACYSFYNRITLGVCQIYYK